MSTIGELMGMSADPRSIEQSTLLAPSTLFGVEVELENVPGVVGSRMKYWDVKEDGSLRNSGAEFVFKQPYGGADIVRALLELENFIQRGGFNPDLTDRTSIHVHMDVRGMTKEQFQRLMILYTIFERVLFNYAGPYRHNNIFCLPIHNAQGMVKYLNQLFLNSDHLFRDAIHRVEKYAAINVRSLANFGSVEFRIHQGEWRAGRITKWINILSHLYNAAMEDASFDDIHMNISGHGPSLYLDTVFGKTAKYLRYDDIDIDIMEGVRLSQDIINYKQMMDADAGGSKKGSPKDMLSKFLNKNQIDSDAITVDEIMSTFKCSRSTAVRALDNGLTDDTIRRVMEWREQQRHLEEIRDNHERINNGGAFADAVNRAAVRMRATPVFEPVPMEWVNGPERIEDEEDL